jgi:hypothetical protein
MSFGVGRSARPRHADHRRARAAAVVADAWQHGRTRRPRPVDDFVVSLTTADGEYRSFRITARTKVDVTDPLGPHKDLLRKYTDADIHNVTAFLATLK